MTDTAGAEDKEPTFTSERLLLLGEERPEHN